MSVYSVVLFIHLLALMLAVGASALAFFAALQLRVADTPADVARWGSLVKAVVPCFPITTLLLAATGAYMTQVQWRWTTPWIDAGIAGLTLIAVCGSGVEARRGRALEQEVRTAGLSPRARALQRDPLSWSAKLTTLTLVAAVVFLMATKPSALGSGVTLVVALLAGPLLAVPLWRSPGRDDASETAGLPPIPQARVGSTVATPAVPPQRAER